MPPEPSGQPCSARHLMRRCTTHGAVRLETSDSYVCDSHAWLLGRSAGVFTSADDALGSAQANFIHLGVCRCCAGARAGKRRRCCPWHGRASQSTSAAGRWRVRLIIVSLPGDVQHLNGTVEGLSSTTPLMPCCTPAARLATTLSLATQGVGCWRCSRRQRCCGCIHARRAWPQCRCAAAAAPARAAAQAHAVCRLSCHADGVVHCMTDSPTPQAVAVVRQQYGNWSSATRILTTVLPGATGSAISGRSTHRRGSSTPLLQGKVPVRSLCRRSASQGGSASLCSMSLPVPHVHALILTA